MGKDQGLRDNMMRAWLVEGKETRGGRRGLLNSGSEVLQKLFYQDVI